MKLITLSLSCANRQEARQIADHLLSQKLVACARLVDVDSAYWWQGQVENAKETLLMMESTAEKFADIETTVRQIHSYKTFVLTAYPVDKASKGVETWLGEALSRPN